MLKTSYATLNYRLFQLIAIFIFFDGIRSNLISGNILTLFREGSIFYLLGYAVFKQKCSFKKIIPISVLCYFLYHTIVSIISVSLQTNITISFIIKPYELLIAIYLFSHFQKLTNQTYEKYILFLVKTGVVFVVLNTVFYFIYIPIWKNYQMWWGRISCGYPTMDVITLSYTLLILLYYPNIKLKSITRIIFIIIILIGSILQFTGTGIVILGVILPFTLLYYIFSPNKQLLKREVLFTFSILLLIVGSTISFIKLHFPQEYAQGESLIFNKIDILTGNVDANDTNTLAIREEQFNKIKKRQNFLFEKIFGIGLGDATNDPEKLKNIKSSFMIEDQYNFTQVCYGYVGLILYILIPFCFIINIVLKKKLSLNTKFFFSGATLIFLSNSKTLILLTLFPNYMYFAFFFALFRISQKQQYYSYTASRSPNIPHNQLQAVLAYKNSKSPKNTTQNQ